MPSRVCQSFVQNAGLQLISGCGIFGQASRPVGRKEISAGLAIAIGAMTTLSCFSQPTATWVHGITLSTAELEALTGYQQATKQLRVLRNRGFARAFISRKGCVVLERAHYEAVAGADNLGGPAPRPKGAQPAKVANLSFLRPA
jgi:hypothetical protein